MSIGHRKGNLMEISIGDIVLISNFKYPDGSDGSLHSFVIIDIEHDDLSSKTTREIIGWANARH